MQHDYPIRLIMLIMTLYGLVAMLMVMTLMPVMMMTSSKKGQSRRQKQYFPIHKNTIIQFSTPQSYALFPATRFQKMKNEK